MAKYGRVIEKLSNARVSRYCAPNPPEIPAAADLPAWSALLASDIPVFVPSATASPQVSGKTGVVKLSR